MSVYVDELMLTLRTNEWPYARGCHLFADNDSELHRLAAQIGLRRDWFSPRIDFHHYDLTASKRLQAIKAGAVAIDRRFVVNHVQQNALRRQGRLS